MGDGGVLPNGFQAKSGSVVNINGGTVGNDFQLESATMNMNGGTVGRVQLNYNSVATISAGNITGFIAVANESSVKINGGYINLLFPSGTAEINGGTIGQARPNSGTFTANGGLIQNLIAESGASVFIAGGNISKMIARDLSKVDLAGGAIGDNVYVGNVAMLSVRGESFQINGIPVAGLDQVGSSVKVQIPDGTFLTGVLSDGLPFEFNRMERTSYFDSNDRFDTGITLVRANPAPVGPQLINVPADNAPLGIGAGQTINVNAGGILQDNFHAASASFVNISGGRTGQNLESMGATVVMTSGHLGHRFDSFSGSSTVISGGTIGDQIEVFQGSTFELDGFDFQIDGVPVSGLTQVGSSVSVNLPSGTQFTGILADGTPFAFTPAGANFQQIATRLDGAFGDRFDNNTVLLRRSNVAPIGPVLIQVPTDPAPTSLRSGQTLMVQSGGNVGDDLMAGQGSRVLVNGGKIGQNFEAIGAVVNLDGGEIGDGFDAYRGTVFTMNAGSLTGTVEALPGSTVNFYGGSIGARIETGGATLNVSGGAFGGIVAIGSDSIANVEGGSFSYIEAQLGSTTNLHGGAFASFNALAGSAINIYGTSFLFGGQPIQGLTNPGDSIVLTNRGIQHLTGRFGNGVAFDFVLDSQDLLLKDYFDSGATLRLNLLSVPEPGSLAIGLFHGMTVVFYWLRRRRMT